jgi:hypothetical protein
VRRSSASSAAGPANAPTARSLPTAAHIVTAYHWAFGGLALLLLLAAAIAARMPVIALDVAKPDTGRGPSDAGSQT